MKNQTYHFEIKTLVAQFCDVLNDVIINRYNDQNVVEDKLHVNFIYAPKTRTIHDVINKAAHIQLPVISVFPAGITRDVNRVFNKIEGPYYSLSQASSGFEHLWQPVPVNIAVNMSILTRFQHDLDQIVTNFVPYCDPYFVVSWKMPNSDLEIRSHVHWSGNINVQYPIDISHSDYYRFVADTSWTIEGWLFKLPGDPVGKIYNIKTSFTAVSSIFSDFDTMNDMEIIPDNTDLLYLSGRPQVLVTDPYLTTPSSNGSIFTIDGKMFDDVTNLYVSGTPGVFELAPSGIPLSAMWDTYATFQNPASGNPRISALYPGFTGIEITKYTIHNDNRITFIMPSAMSIGYIDVIAFNEAGYGILTTDSVRPTSNPYPVTLPEHYTYVPYQPPYISGIQIGLPTHPTNICPNEVVALTAAVKQDISIAENLDLAVNINGSATKKYIVTYTGDTTGEIYDLNTTFYGAYQSVDLSEYGFVGVTINNTEYFMQVYDGQDTTTCSSNIIGPFYTTGTFVEQGYALVNVNNNALRYVIVYSKL